jgi:hypothetical protein
MSFGLGGAATAITVLATRENEASGHREQRRKSSRRA